MSFMSLLRIYIKLHKGVHYVFFEVCECLGAEEERHKLTEVAGH